MHQIKTKHSQGHVNSDSKTIQRVALAHKKEEKEYITIDFVNQPIPTNPYLPMLACGVVYHVRQPTTDRFMTNAMSFCARRNWRIETLYKQFYR
jgi:hypothetical protein